MAVPEVVTGRVFVWLRDEAHRYIAPMSPVEARRLASTLMEAADQSEHWAKESALRWVTQP